MQSNWLQSYLIGNRNNDSARGGSSRAEFSIVAESAHFVNRKIAQFLNILNPEICANYTTLPQPDPFVNRQFAQKCSLTFVQLFSQKGLTSASQDVIIGT